MSQHNLCFLCGSPDGGESKRAPCLQVTPDFVLIAELKFGIKRKIGIVSSDLRRPRFVEAIWQGPFSWPNYEKQNGLPPAPEQPGLYLQTVAYRDGYLIYAAGLTRRTIHQRLREHTRKYRRGDYTVLDIDALQRGERVEVWHGWGWMESKRREFEARQTLISEAAERQLAGFRVFAADIGIEPRLLERLEAAIMNALYHQSSPLREIPDRGMMLAPRRNTETSMQVNNRCGSLLYGLPSQLEI